MINYAMHNDLKDIGIVTPGTIRRNWPVTRLVEDTLRLDGGRMGPQGAVMIDTGKYTGRSPNDRYIVDEPSSRNHIGWGAVNKKVSEEVFDGLFQKVLDYYNSDPDGQGIYLFEGLPGIDPAILKPRGAWSDPQAYDAAARLLAEKFVENFQKYVEVEANLVNAGPQV